MSFFKNKNVLVTGGTGLIGRQLVDLLISHDANVTIVSLDDNIIAPKEVNFQRADLRKLENCLDVCKGKEIVFNLVGIKGSPKMAMSKPASFFVPTITFSINMMEAARLSGVDRYLYTSSVGVYSPAEIFYEDDVWKTFPSKNDKFAGWAKRMGELQAEAYKIEYNWDKISIVRPANVYGPYDNFDPENAMVIPSLINRALSESGPLNVWGDGSPIRDFIHSKDVALGMMMAVEKNITAPINLGSGEGVSIANIANTIVNNIPGEKKEIIWDTSKPSGDKKRLMDTSRAKSYGFKTTVSLDDGIKDTINWFIKNKDFHKKRYNSFTEKK